MHGSLEELFAADDAKRDVMGSDEAREGEKRVCQTTVGVKLK